MRFLPEYSGRGRDRRKLQYAILAAAAVHGGTEPDLLDEVAWWQADDFWQHALLAAVLYIRAAADRAGVPVPQVCTELDERPGLQAADGGNAPPSPARLLLPTASNRVNSSNSNRIAEYLL